MKKTKKAYDLPRVQKSHAPPSRTFMSQVHSTKQSIKQIKSSMKAYSPPNFDKRTNNSIQKPMTSNLIRRMAPAYSSTLNPRADSLSTLEADKKARILLEKFSIYNNKHIEKANSFIVSDDTQDLLLKANF